MSYCLNPTCHQPQNQSSAVLCASCGNSLVLSDRYRALKIIGQGGFGRTFLAVDESQPLKPRCVIKQFLPPNISTLAASKLFREEAERLKSLGSHPQIPTFLDYLEINEQRYIVQEFIDGSNLEQELVETGAWNETQIRQLLNNILPVLEFVHQHYVIHRDIKPENIIRRSSNHSLVLVDFGAAKYATGTALLKTGTTIGTAGFTAPEQLMGKAVFQSDLYSLGVTCVHLLTQIPPFDLVDSAEGSWVWRNYLNSSVSEQLGNILDNLLERGTRKRYTSATAVTSDLVAKPSPTAAISSVNSLNTVEKERRGIRSKIVAVSITFVVGVGAVTGIRFGAVYFLEAIKLPIVVRVPQPQTQPRLTPVPKTSPTPLNPQPLVKVLDKDSLIPIISSAGKLLSILLIIRGMFKVFNLQKGEELSPGLSLMLMGLMITVMLNMISNILLSTLNNNQTTPISSQPQK